MWLFLTHFSLSPWVFVWRRRKWIDDSTINSHFSTIFENVLSAIRNNSLLLIFLRSTKKNSTPSKAQFCLISMNFGFFLLYSPLQVIQISRNYHVEWSWIYFWMLKNTQDIDRWRKKLKNNLRWHTNFFSSVSFFFSLLWIISLDWSLLGFSSKWMKSN